jgi:L-malate glycosyltransferase
MPDVLHLLNSFDPGGTERQAVQLTRLLHESGRYRPRVACLDAAGTLRAEVERLPIGDIPEFALTSFYDRNAARQLRRLVRYLREHDIAVMHTHEFYPNILGMAAASLARVPARVASRRHTTGFRTPAQNFVERCSFRLADAVLVNAHAVRDFLVRGGVPSRKIVTVHNGVDMRRIEPSAALTRDAALAVMKLPGDRRFVTIVANVEHRVKDHSMFLRAARRVRHVVPAVAFVIAGEGRLLESLREHAAALGLASDVFFTGRCEHVAELLAVSEVCVLSSKAEGSSNAILEYMAAGRPVVATDVGGAREAVVEGETGFLVPAGDDEQMAERVSLLLREPARAMAMGARGARIVREKFSCSAQLNAVESLYAELLA